MRNTDPIATQGRLPFTEMVATAQKFMRWYLQRLKAAGTDVSAETFWADWDVFAERRDARYTAVDMRAMCAYVSGALRLTPRLLGELVWRDSRGGVRHTAPPWPDEPEPTPPTERSFARPVLV